VNELAGGGNGLQRQCDEAAGRGAEGGELQPAAAEHGATAEDLGEQRLTAADGPDAGGRDRP